MSVEEVLEQGGKMLKQGGRVVARELQDLSPTQAAFIGASLLVGITVGRARMPWRRFSNMNDVPGHLFGSKAPILKGRALTVSDGDTIRFLHKPTFFSSSQLGPNEKASEVALPIRVCTIDTPETAKFGKEGQAFADEAKKHLQSMAQDKMVGVRLLQKDQYGRGVAEVYTGSWPFRKSVDEEMLKAGLAEVYRGGGAVYGSKGKDAYVAIESAAQSKKVGIWSLKDRESAAQYKSRTKDSTSQ
mmetsp:Transcript_39160/g.96405  ORF Transcript_39160/g.96405 Transcript_39160/m.96405 type:complete len:244 (+) Transcript_39160:139-870(+)